MKTQHVILLLALSALAPQYSLANSPTFSNSHEALLQYFKSGKEKAAKDAIWTTSNIFKVGVIPDGTIRDGYANYVCEVAYDHGLKGKGVWVQVIDIVALKRSGKWTQIGNAHCQ
jgi:hypothetical protein